MKKLFLLLSIFLIVAGCNETIKGVDFTYTIDKTNPLNVSFYSNIPNSNNYGDLSVVWDFGDGVTSTEANPVHSYSKSAIYNVKLSVKSSKNFIDSIDVIKQIPLELDIVGLDFTYKVDPDNPLALLFEAVGTIENGIIDYEWDFGTGKTSKGKTVSHQFSNLGVYSVVLKASVNETTFSKTLTKQVEVKLSISDLDFTYNADPANPLNVQFTAKAVASLGELEYEWDFGFGVTKQGKTVVHKFSNVGTFNIRLTAKIIDSTVTVSIDKTINTSIYIDNADFTYGSNETDPLEVYFNATGSSSAGELTFEWDFGRGETTKGKNAIFRFTNYGEYIVNLRVLISGTTVVQSISKNISIVAPTIDTLNFTYDIKNPRKPLEIYFEATGSSSYGELEYQWDFGYGQLATSNMALHTFDLHTIYIVKLKATIKNTKVSKTISKSLDLDANAKIDFDCSFIDDIKNLKTTCVPKIGDIAGNIIYSWDFGDKNSDNNFSNNENGQHVYTAMGRYKVKLTVDSDALDAPVYFEKNLDVLPTPKLAVEKIEHSADWQGDRRRENFINNTWSPFDSNTVDVNVSWTGYTNGEVKNFTGGRIVVYDGKGRGQILISISYTIKETDIKTELLPPVVHSW